MEPHGHAGILQACLQPRFALPLGWCLGDVGIDQNFDVDDSMGYLLVGAASHLKSLAGPSFSRYMALLVNLGFHVLNAHDGAVCLDNAAKKHVR